MSSDRGVASLLLVEDDPRIRDVIRGLVDASPHALAGECATIAQARRAIERAAPDVLLLDLGLPDGTGADLLRDLRARRLLPSAVVVLTVFDDDDHIFEALRAGAIGYLLKDELLGRLLDAVGEALAGGAPMSPRIARRVLQSFHPTVAAAPDEDLTARERQVIELLSKGATYHEIGQMLAISTNTVRTYIRSTYEKLHVSSKAEATTEAMRRGIIPRP